MRDDMVISPDRRSIKASSGAVENLHKIHPKRHHQRAGRAEMLSHCHYLFIIIYLSAENDPLRSEFTAGQLICLTDPQQRD